jgi:hypothetical protein
VKSVEEVHEDLAGVHHRLTRARAMLDRHGNPAVCAELDAAISGLERAGEDLTGERFAESETNGPRNPVLELPVRRIE